EARSHCDKTDNDTGSRSPSRLRRAAGRRAVIERKIAGPIVGAIAWNAERNGKAVNLEGAGPEASCRIRSQGRRGAHQKRVPARARESNTRGGAGPGRLFSVDRLRRHIRSQSARLEKQRPQPLPEKDRAGDLQAIAQHGIGYASAAAGIARRGRTSDRRGEKNPAPRNQRSIGRRTGDQFVELVIGG